MSTKHEVAVELAGGKRLVFETGRMAKQASGAALVTTGETVVLAALEAVKPETPKLKEIADGLVERTYEQVVEDVLKARAGGMTFRDIEKKFGLKQRHGNNARRICLHCQGHPILQNAEQEKLQ